MLCFELTIGGGREQANVTALSDAPVFVRREITQPHGRPKLFRRRAGIQLLGRAEGVPRLDEVRRRGEGR